MDSRFRGNDGYLNRSTHLSRTGIGEPSCAAAASARSRSRLCASLLGAGAGAQARGEGVVQLAAHAPVGGELVAEIPLLPFERDAGEFGQLLAGELGVEPAGGKP